MAPADLKFEARKSYYVSLVGAGSNLPKASGSVSAVVGAGSNLPKASVIVRAGLNLPVLRDSVLVTYFPAPNSYTGEDIVEISCHGSLPVLKGLLEACLGFGARLADRGEFTKRAFLNGKLDLTQAEAVQELISAKTELAAEIALQGLTGSLSHKIKETRQQLVDLLSHLEAAIDFPEEIEFLSDNQFELQLSALAGTINQLVESAQLGKIIKDGIRVAIIGRPNVGKSTLLNALLGEERALISHIPGTTRDTIEEMLNIEGIPIHLIDTAGLRETKDEIEQMGMARTRQKAQESNIVLLVLDAGDLWTSEDKKFLEEYSKEKCLVVINKIDLAKQTAALVQLTEPDFYHGEIVQISAKQNKGLSKLRTAIKDLAVRGIPPKTDGLVITNLRQLEKLKVSALALHHLEQAVNANVPPDCFAVDLKSSIVALGEITGEQVSEEVINNIFDKFCVGK